jgi:predicted GNAT family N-acyltransferase
MSHADVPVRSAAFDELAGPTAYRLWALRSEVFVVEQAAAYLDLDGRDLEPGTRHLWVEADGLPVAKQASARSKVRGMPYRKTAAACRASRRRRWRFTS